MDKASQREYLKNNYRRISLNLNNVKDRDILEAIGKEDPHNIQRGIKRLIRKSINNGD